VPFEYAVSKVPPLVVVRGFGVVDEQMCQDVLRQITNDPSFALGMPILIDATEITAAPDLAVRALAREWPIRMSISRGAIVTTRDVALACGDDIDEMSRRTLRVFTDADVALAWLRS
jgi:hypothetical protein